MSTRSSKAAEAFFKKQDKQAAMSEYEQQQQAVQENWARLRALRLAKEAADREAAEQAAAEKAAKKPTKRRKTAAAKDSASA